MLLCQNAQTFNLEGSLVSGPGPLLPHAREWTSSGKGSLHLGAHQSLQRLYVFFTANVAEDKDEQDRRNRLGPGPPRGPGPSGAPWNLVGGHSATFGRASSSGLCPVLWCGSRTASAWQFPHCLDECLLAKRLESHTRWRECWLR